MQSVQLSIPTPCHQNWDKMTPTEQGRFCNACAKQVVDFTTMSDGEVLNYFVNKKDENICGRTLPNQLNRVLEAPKPIVPTKLWYWKYAAAAGLLFMGKEGVGQSQTNFTVGEIAPQSAQINSGASSLLSTIIKGIVVDENNQLVPYASIKIKNTQKGVSADLDGKFEIKAISNVDELIVSSSGFTAVTYKLVEGNNIVVKLKRAKIDGKEIVVTGSLGRISLVKKPLLNQAATIIIKDKQSNQPLTNINLSIKSKSTNKTDLIFSSEGEYNIKDLILSETYTIQASKEGYVSKAIEIRKENFNSRKGVFEIVLEKNKLITKVVNNEKITLRGSIITKFSTDPIYVVDGIIDPNAKNIKSNDIEKIEVLKGAAATVLFGQDGTNGVIIITTKKQKVKKDTLPTPNYKLMDEVIVNYNPIKGKISYSTTTCTSKVTMGAIISGMTITTTHTDTIKQKIQNFFSPIKTYPNPVKKGEMLTLSFPNKNKFYTIQIINAVGVVMLQNKRQDGLVSTDAYTKNITQQIPIVTTWSSGYYFINILNEQGKPITKSSFLVL